MDFIVFYLNATNINCYQTDWLMMHSCGDKLFSGNGANMMIGIWHSQQSCKRIFSFHVMLFNLVFHYRLKSLFRLKSVRLILVYFLSSITTNYYMKHGDMCWDPRRKATGLHFGERKAHAC